MFSLQTMLNGKDKTLELLQASSEAATEAAIAVNQMTHGGDFEASVARITAARRREKELNNQITEEMIRKFVTSLDREDLEAASSALYKVPKTIEKFASRYVLVTEHLKGVNFSRRTEILEECMQTVSNMVKELKNGLNITAIYKWQDHLQALEGEADNLMLEPYKDLYIDKNNPTRAILAQALFEILEQAIDNCRDAGNVIYFIVLKNS